MKTPLIVKIDFEVPFLNVNVGVIYYEVSSHNEEIMILQKLGNICKKAIEEYRANPDPTINFSMMTVVRKNLISYIVNHNGYINDEDLSKDKEYLKFLKERYGFEGNKNYMNHACGILTIRDDYAGNLMIDVNRINYIIIKEDDTIEFCVGQNFTQEELDQYYQSLPESEA